MSADDPSPRTRRIVEAASDKTSAIGKSEKEVTSVESEQLLKLYRQLPEASKAARDALQAAGEKPSAAALQNFRELDEKVNTILARINQILG
jgi:hypothetical protein